MDSGVQFSNQKCHHQIVFVKRVYPPRYECELGIKNGMLIIIKRQSVSFFYERSLDVYFKFWFRTEVLHLIREICLG